MRGFLYVVYDQIADESSAPMVEKSDAVALRVFDSIKVSNHLRDSDYSLLKIGTFDSEGPRMSVFDTFVAVEAKNVTIQDAQSASQMELPLEGGK